MLEATDGYKSAIVGDVRRMAINAVLEIVDPDISYGAVKSSGEAPWSKPEQIHNKVMDLGPRYSTLEPGRWVLDGSCGLIPDDPQKLTGEVGTVGNALCDSSGVFSPAVFVELKISNVSILQACSVFFSKDPVDGVPEDFTVSVLSAGQEIYSKPFYGNRETSVNLDGFTVFDPDAIRVTVTKWSLPRRRLRIAEIIPGVYEKWTEDVLASVDIQMRGNFSCLSIPYGTCTLRLDNFDRRFEPRNKNGVFQSIEDRQGIPISIGVYKEDGTVEHKRVGVFYQYSGGWKTGDNDATIQWDLVDIVGLISDREFVAPASLPTTLSGWIAALAGQLGENFKNRWHVDPKYSGAAVTVNDKKDVENRRCGDILRYVCMATGTWPRADAETGDLTAEPFWNQGAKMDLDNMTVYPVMKANDDLAVLTFRLYDGKETLYNVSGNATSSSKTLSIDNPFIHTAEQALTASRQILSQYGGVKLETVGRGNPASEIGDVDTVVLDESTATTARRMEQGFSFNSGVLRDCKSVLLQADGSFMFEDRLVVTKSGKVHIPPGVSEVRAILVQGGQGGSRGEDGHLSANPFEGVQTREGENGSNGRGGKIWSGIIKVNPDTDYNVEIGKGGAPSDVFGVPGGLGTDTKFGQNSSESGKVYSPSYTDIASGSAYGRSGVQAPSNGTGDGGTGGKGGNAAAGHREPKPNGHGDMFVLDVPPGKGAPGVRGADGVCIVYWKKVK